MSDEQIEKLTNVLSIHVNQLQSISDKANSIFRVNFIIVSIFLPITAATIGQDGINVNNVFNNTYTQLGLLFWTFSMIAALSTQYLSEKQASLQLEPFQELSSAESAQDFESSARDTIERFESIIVRSRYAVLVCFLLSLVTAILLGMGAISAVADPSPTQTFIWSVLVIIGFILVSAGIFGLFKSGINHDTILSGIKAIVGDESPQPWDDLTEMRKEIILAIAESSPNEPFTRSEINKKLEQDNTTDNNRVPITILNQLAKEDGYLKKVQQGGAHPFVLYTEADENDVSVAPYADLNSIQELANNALTDANIDPNSIDHIDWDDPQNIIETVNNLVGKHNLVVVSNPSKYILTEKGEKFMNGLENL